MASNTEHDELKTEAQSAAQDIPQKSGAQQEELPTSTPVEMSSLPSTSTPAQADTLAPLAEFSKPTEESFVPRGPIRTDTTTAISQAENPPPPPPPAAAAAAASDSTPVTRIVSTAIGPSSDQPVMSIKDAEASGPTLTIVLLLTSGARHPFKLDGKYLSKRNVEVAGNDPFNLSVYKLKELILREWRDEWETKPSSPSYIRLISFGKLLDDKAPLKDSRFNHDAPNVVHMTIKPLDFVDEEDAKGGKGTYTSGRENEGRSPGCRCSVM